MGVYQSVQRVLILHRHAAPAARRFHASFLPVSHTAGSLLHSRHLAVALCLSQHAMYIQDQAG